MLTTIKGYYERGKVVLEEEPPLTERAEVIVTFLPGKKEASKKRTLGILEGKASIPDDFDEPLDDLKEYM